MTTKKSGTAITIKFVQAVWEEATMFGVELPDHIDPTDTDAVNEWIEETLEDHLSGAIIETGDNVQCFDSETTWTIDPA